MPKGGCWGGRGAGTEGSFKCEVDVLTFSGDAKKSSICSQLSTKHSSNSLLGWMFES